MVSKQVKHRTISTYSSYNFVDQDPVVDVMRTILHDEGVNLQQAEVASRVRANTIKNWLNGETKKPQFATLNAVARAFGKKFAVVDINHAEKVVPTARPRSNITQYIGAKKRKEKAAKNKAQKQAAERDKRIEQAKRHIAEHSRRPESLGV